MPNGQCYLYSGASLFGKNNWNRVTEYSVTIYATLVRLFMKDKTLVELEKQDRQLYLQTPNLEE
ncbi:hypothetical protein, partial [Planococcus sp. ISL-110]|uniref:hypothetical protein n=1 Tax=Planococcus sp. ISL-110 TaxID=2819167 RepID=UPI001BE870ED